MLSGTILLLWTSIASTCTAQPRRRSRACVVKSSYKESGGKADDTPNINQAFQSCHIDAIIQFREGVSYNVFQPVIQTNLSNVEIRLLGNLHLPSDIPTVQARVRANNGQRLSWFTFAGPRIDIKGSTNVTAGWINSYGQAWWDANPPGKTGLEARPHLFTLNTTDGTLSHFKSRKPIAWNVQLSGKNILVNGTVIDAVSTGRGFPFNTDGFGVGGQNITILNSTIMNGDDAIAVQSGAKNVLFEGGVIGYQTHGMSIGSLGQNRNNFAAVSDVRFNNVTVNGGVYAARFKSWKGGRGLVKNVVWSNIRVVNVTFPIFVTQTYYNQGSAQTKPGNGSVLEQPTDSAVEMSDFAWVNFTGTINTSNPGDGSCVSDPCWYNAGLPGLKHTEAIIMNCATEQSCKNFRTSGIQLLPENGQAPWVICSKATAALNPELGFQCQNGTHTTSKITDPVPHASTA